MNVMPTCCWIALSSICISCRSFRSSAPSGSSRSSTRGRLTSARASATRWRWPPESCAGLAGLVALEADHPERLGRALPPLVLRDLADDQAVRDVVADRHVREEGVVLEDRVDVALVGGQAGDVRAVKEDASRRSAARSRRSSEGSSSCPSPTAQQREELALADVEVDARDRDDVAIGLRRGPRAGRRPRQRRPRRLPRGRHLPAHPVDGSTTGSSSAGRQHQPHDRARAPRLAPAVRSWQRNDATCERAVSSRLAQGVEALVAQAPVLIITCLTTV